MRSKVVVIVLLATALLVVGTASAASPIHQVSGGGTLMLEELGTSESFGFVAQVDGDGVVSGQGTIRISGAGAFHFEVNCLSVEGNTAWLGGVITRSADPDTAPTGLEFTWQLQDNGQGADAAPDLQSYMFPTALLPLYGLGNDCNDRGDLFSLGTFEWSIGNLQVR